MAETHLSVDDLILPLFVTHGSGVREEIPSMSGQARLSVDSLAREVEEVASLGIPAVLLFGIPERKDAVGSEAYASDGVVQRAVREIKRVVPDLVVITDVCLCEYTDHGHCGVIKSAQRKGGSVLLSDGDGEVDNDATLPLLQKTALSHAEAGADMVAPSDMMDGRVGAIRGALDAAGFTDMAIMAYAAKYCSAFYGPFREAAESAPSFGDRKTYQMAPPNRREALREVELDIAEGADIVMVKPALPYLDVISEVKAAFPVPLAAYNVSGEFAMVKAAARLGWLDEKKATFEVLTAIKRAGADIIITYHAREVARWLGQGEDPFS